MAGTAVGSSPFEPLSEAFSALERRASRDSHWQVHRLALGDRDGTAEINVAGNSWSSSLLPMGAQHLRSAPQSAYVGTESVPIARLDSIWDDLIDAGSRVWFKMTSSDSRQWSSRAPWDACTAFR